MNTVVIDKNNKKYVECASAEASIHTEQNALDLIAACIENDTNLLMIHAEALVDDFFELRTGLAGSILQKFVNYHVKAVVVLTDSQKMQGRFKELSAESNKGSSFRVFSSKAEAENWLLAE
jgi:PadR family transcriptional regulator AphA